MHPSLEFPEGFLEVGVWRKSWLDSGVSSRWEITSRVPASGRVGGWEPVVSVPGAEVMEGKEAVRVRVYAKA